MFKCKLKLIKKTSTDTDAASGLSVVHAMDAAPRIETCDR